VHFHGRGPFWTFSSTAIANKTLAAAIEPDRREQLKQDFIEFHERYRTDLGIAMPREYLVTIGYRR